MAVKPILLAAGLGERLRPFTDVLPKCLMPINGVPLLEYWLASIYKLGMQDVLVNVHYRSADVIDFPQNDNNSNIVVWSNLSKITGDDPVSLYKCDGICSGTHEDDQQTGELIDVIGTPGVDSGPWYVAGEEDGTKDHTLVRKPSVITGNTDWVTSAGTDANDSEWIVYERNTFDYGGTHTNTLCDNFVNITTISNQEPQFIEITDDDSLVNQRNIICIIIRFDNKTIFIC